MTERKEESEQVLRPEESQEQESSSSSSSRNISQSDVGISRPPLHDEETQPAFADRDDAEAIKNILLSVQSQEQQQSSCSGAPSLIFPMSGEETQPALAGRDNEEAIENVLQPAQPQQQQPPSDSPRGLPQNATSRCHFSMYDEETQPAFAAQEGPESTKNVGHHALDSMICGIPLEKVRPTEFPQLSIREVDSVLHERAVEPTISKEKQIEPESSQSFAKEFERIMNEPSITSKEIPDPTHPTAAETRSQPEETSSLSPQLLDFVLQESEAGAVQSEECIPPKASADSVIGEHEASPSMTSGQIQAVPQRVEEAGTGLAETAQQSRIPITRQPSYPTLDEVLQAAGLTEEDLAEPPRIPRAESELETRGLDAVMIVPPSRTPVPWTSEMAAKETAKVAAERFHAAAGYAFYTGPWTAEEAEAMKMRSQPRTHFSEKCPRRGMSISEPTESQKPFIPKAKKRRRFEFQQQPPPRRRRRRRKSESSLASVPQKSSTRKRAVSSDVAISKKTDSSLLEEEEELTNETIRKNFDKALDFLDWCYWRTGEDTNQLRSMVRAADKILVSWKRFIQFLEAVQTPEET